jgi:hypothetical protein
MDMERKAGRLPDSLKTRAASREPVSSATVLYMQEPAGVLGKKSFGGGK